MWPNACGSAGASWSSGRVRASFGLSLTHTPFPPLLVTIDWRVSPLTRIATTRIPQQRQQRPIINIFIRKRHLSAGRERSTDCSEKNADSGSETQRSTTAP